LTYMPSTGRRFSGVTDLFGNSPGKSKSSGYRQVPEEAQAHTCSVGDALLG
jgi:hypothetical protein